MKVKIAIRFIISPLKVSESRCLLGLCFANLHVCGNISAATQPEGIEDGLTMGACTHLRHRLEVESCSRYLAYQQGSFVPREGGLRPWLWKLHEGCNKLRGYAVGVNLSDL